MKFSSKNIYHLHQSFKLIFKYLRKCFVYCFLKFSDNLDISRIIQYKMSFQIFLIVEIGYHVRAVTGLFLPYISRVKYFRGPALLQRY